MCTVTIIRPDGFSFRLVTNRDEKRTRPLALPPREHRLGSGRRALWPIDAASGGTWVAAHDGAVALTVLNLNPRVRPQLLAKHHLVSRGLIVPQLIDHPSALAAVEDLSSLQLERFAPFRLIAVDEVETIEARWDRVSLRTTHFGVGPLCFVSSGLGDHLVEPRLPLFEDVVVAQGATIESQDEFHDHRWPDHPQISVHMDRPDARTVSRTSVTVSRDSQLEMTYEGDDRNERICVPARSDAPCIVGERRRQPC